MKTIPCHPSSSDARGHPLAQLTLRPKHHVKPKCESAKTEKAARKRKIEELSVKVRVGALGLVSYYEWGGLGRLGSPSIFL